jgi:hypothetical protein
VLLSEIEIQRTSREAEKSGRQHGRLPYSHTAFQHVAQAVGKLFVERRPDIEEELIREFDVPAEARSVCASLDRVSVPMEEPRARPGGRPRKGAAKRPVARVFRMAYCGTITLCDAGGEVVHTLRYARMAGGDARELCQGMAADVAEILAKKPDLQVQLLNDGAHEMWNLLLGAFTPEVLGQKPRELVDFHHLVGKLAAAAKVVDDDQAPSTVERWKFRLLNRSDAAAGIRAELDASGCEHVRDADQEPVHEALTYLTNHAGRLDYAKARRLGLPIGSGPVEASCKTLFNIRFKRAGARWKEQSGEHVMQLRALALSDRWEPAIAKAVAPLRKPIRVAA